jgi:ribosome-binding protein aMBF1 (putative translation factor)
VEEMSEISETVGRYIAESRKKAGRSQKDLADLYQALHAWKLAQAYDKKYLAKVEKAMKDDPLYKDEG